MKVLQILLLVGGLSLTAIGILGLGAAGIFYFSTSSFVNRATAATAVVTGLHSGNTANGSVYYPVFRFIDTHGLEHELTSKVGSSPPAFSVGQRIEVLYEPGHPDGARVKTFMSLWLFTVAFLIAGGVPILLGIVFLVGAWLAARAAAAQAAPPPLPPA